MAVELTYGCERIAMYLQDKDSVCDLQWNDTVPMARYTTPTVQQSTTISRSVRPNAWQKLFDLYREEMAACMERELVLPAYDYVLKCSHTFNLLDARGVISRDERMNYILRIRRMAEQVARLYVEQREAMGFPLLQPLQAASSSEGA
ncbi:MAG: glycine--tRNA ligase subunit alpha [Vampirovibrionales bacterium]